MLLREWVINKLEQVLEYNRILVCDPLNLLPQAYGAIDNLAQNHGFTVIRASTNLAFRDTYERVLQDPEVKKIMILDQTPCIRLLKHGVGDAPPLFYPDFLEKCPAEARLKLDLHQYLRDVTGDGSWPPACNEPRYARLMIPRLSEVLTAYGNMRLFDKKGFTDSNFNNIVTFAALGIPDLAFKKLGAEEYWRIGLLGHETLHNLKNLAPNVVDMFNAELKKAPIPFCWFADRDAETIVNGLYLAAILNQHTKQWSLLLGNIDPIYSPFKNIDEAILEDDVPRLVAIDIGQAERDLRNLEKELDSEQLELILVEQLNITEPENFASLIEKECYSVFFRSLALLMALDNMLSAKPAREVQKRVQSALFQRKELCMVDHRSDTSGQHLIETYNLMIELEPLSRQLLAVQKELNVKKPENLEWGYFRNIWIDKKLGRLEYLASSLERQIYNADLLPRKVSELPDVFTQVVDRIRLRVRTLCDEINFKLGFVNGKFQEMIHLRYPQWVQEQDNKIEAPVLTSRFLERCLKPFWDPQTEKAAIFIFDGMRYDIWDLLLKDSISEHMDVVSECPGFSLLPTETHVSRKAISAGAYPDSFDSSRAEDKLLRESLKKIYHKEFPLEVAVPEGGGTGETVHYRADNLDVYIFELCDTELHNIKVKKLPDGREVPVRPLAFLYQQQVRNIIENEVMTIIRGLAPETKVFITADHGFTRVGRQSLGINDAWVYMPQDCSYQNCMFNTKFGEIKAPKEITNQMIGFTPSQLRIPAQITRMDPKNGKAVQQEFKALVFPKVGNAFKRPGSPFRPDAFSHGGISIQEMLIPMIILKVKQPDLGLLNLGMVQGRQDLLEGEMAEFAARIDYQADQLFADDIRVDIRASYAMDSDQYSLPPQVLYIGTEGAEVNYTFKPDVEDASLDERRQGLMSRLFTLEISYRDGHKIVRKSRSQRFNVKLNAEKIVRRVPSHLGNILGMTPKSMR